MKNWIVESIILAAGLIVLGLLLNTGINNFTSRDRVVTVKGLAEMEVAADKVIWPLMYKDIAKPDLYVYLYQNTERLQENIKKRGRDYEQNIQNDYLEKINAGYLEFLKNQTELNVKIIDISNRDFIENRADYLWILEAICTKED